MRARFKKWNFYSDRVEVRIEGFQIGKLLDAAAKNGILLRSVRVYAETEAQAEIAACDLKRLQKLAGARYRVKPRARRGAVYQ
ncbi:MAG: sporulation protein YqfD, partial [Clostridia bacterium]